MRHVVLFGPPNAGKTTLFNLLTGSKQSVVNYPGATVDIGIGSLVVPKRRKMAGVSSQVRVLDVPGVLSFVPQSEDERLSMQAISGLDQVISGAHATPDLIICVMDATQRSRHLAMTKRLIDDGYPVMVVITMIDEAKAQGVMINHVALSKALGVSVFAINARKPTNIDAIIDGVSINSVPCGRLINPKPFHLNDMVAAYAWADKVMKTCETVVSARKPMDMDNVLLHPIWGYVVFFGIMAAFFNVLYIVAAPMMEIIDTSFGALSGWVMGSGAPSWWRAFIAEGLISGLGGVLVFVPQIALLFFLY